MLGSATSVKRPPFTSRAGGDVKELAGFPHQDTVPYPSRYYDCLPGTYLNDVLGSIFFEYDINTP